MFTLIWIPSVLASLSELLEKEAHLRKLIVDDPEVAVTAIAGGRSELQRLRDESDKLNSRLAQLERDAKVAADAIESSSSFEKYLDEELAEIGSYVYHILKFSEEVDDIQLMIECTLMEISKARHLIPRIEAKRLTLIDLIDMSTRVIRHRQTRMADVEAAARSIQEEASMFLSLPAMVDYQGKLLNLIKPRTPEKLKVYIQAVLEIVSNMKQCQMLRDATLNLYEIDRKLTAAEESFNGFDPHEPLPIKTATALGSLIAWHAHLVRAVQDGYDMVEPQLKRTESLMQRFGLEALYVQRKFLNLPISSADSPISQEDFVKLETTSGSIKGFASFFMNNHLGELYLCWSVLVGSYGALGVGSLAMWDAVTKEVASLEVEWSQGASPDSEALFRKPAITIHAMVTRKVDSRTLAVGRL